MLRCTATITETPGEDPRFGKWSKHGCDDSGRLTKKRTETADEEFLNATLDFIDRANRDKKPFLAWFNSTRIHIWTRLKPEAPGKTGLRREQHWVCRSERVELVAATLGRGRSVSLSRRIGAQTSRTRPVG